MTEETAIEMFVGGLVLDPQSQHPVVVLKDETGSITLPIWIGVAEATSIASAIKQITLPRPLTHDLMTSLFDELGVEVQRIVITELKEQTYYAELILSLGDKVMIVDSRPSDALAIAVRTSAPIFVASKVIEQARSAPPTALIPGPELNDPSSAEGGSTEAQGGEGAATEAEGQSASEEQPAEEGSGKNFSLHDKTKWKDLLADLDPDDFKFKM